MAIPETKARVPFGLRCDDAAEGTTLRYWWLNLSGGVGRLLLPTVWGAILWSTGWSVSEMGRFLREAEPMMLGFVALFLAISLVLIYMGVADLINRSVFTLGRQALHVRHGPISWPYRGRTLRREDIIEVRVESSRGRGSSTCWLEATLAGDRHIRLSHRVHNHTDARFHYIAARIAQWLDTPAPAAVEANGAGT